MGTLLEVSNLKVYFRTGEGAAHAVDGVDFTLNEGEAPGIVGESGSGKSVTSLAIMRLLPMPPAEIVDGSIQFDGTELTELQEDEMRKVRGGKIAMIFQEPMTSLNPVLTIERQLIEPPQIHLGLRGRKASNRAQALLEAVGIPEAKRRLKQYPHQFSGGMRQRVMIAIALATNPKLLIARLRRDLNTAVMLITHDLGVVAGVTDRVVVMYAGKVAEEAPTEELFEDPRHPYTLGLLGSDPRSPPDQLHHIEGCPFQPHCPFVLPRCKTYPPAITLSRNIAPTAGWKSRIQPSRRASGTWLHPPRPGPIRGRMVVGHAIGWGGEQLSASFLKLGTRLAGGPAGGVAMALHVRASTEEERTTIARLTRAQTAPVRLARRARIIELSADRLTVPRIARQLDLGEKAVRQWVTRFNRAGVDGLDDAPRVGRPAT